MTAASNLDSRQSLAATQPPDELFVFYIEKVFAIADTWVADPGNIPDRGRKADSPKLIFISMAGPTHIIKSMRHRLNQGYIQSGHLQALNDQSTVPQPHGDVDTTALRNRAFFETRLPTPPGEASASHLIAMTRAHDAPPRYQVKAPRDETVVYTYARSADRLATAFYQIFTERTTIPTIPEWADQIWDVVRDNGMAQKLPSSANIHAWRCDINDQLLIPIISEQVRQGKLPLP